MTGLGWGLRKIGGDGGGVFFLGGGFVCAVIYFLDNIVLHYSVTDTWFWKLDLAYGYLVKGVYKLLPSDDQQAQLPIIDMHAS
jgi:hypothetical protein